MAYYNHFGNDELRTELFGNLPVGAIFRVGKHKNGRRRIILCEKTGQYSYKELHTRNRKETKLFGTHFQVFIGDSDE